MLYTAQAAQQCAEDKPLAWLGGLRPSEFLRDYWQKKPLLVRGAFTGLAELLSIEELCQLAEDEQCESRLIRGPSADDQWSLEQGPFAPVTWRKQGASNWTVLVQAVDHVLPPLSDLLDHFAFIPQWRIDDVMVSAAMPGGSVGPHMDQYDVFLLQGAGRRHWQLGQYCDGNTPTRDDVPLRMLRDFQLSFEATVEPGDLLYVPPGLAHHGVAETACLTYSVGFRAPAVARLVDAMTDTLLNEQAQELLFADGDRTTSRQTAVLSLGDTSALHHSMMAWLNQPQKLAEAVAYSLSEPKYADYEPEGEPCSLDELKAGLEAGFDLMRDPASRWLWLEHNCSLWRNGTEVPLPEAVQAHMPQLLQSRRLRAHDLLALPDDVLAWFANDISAGYWLAVDPPASSAAG